jgi:hypothetical protein
MRAWIALAAGNPQKEPSGPIAGRYAAGAKDFFVDVTYRTDASLRSGYGCL